MKHTALVTTEEIKLCRRFCSSSLFSKFELEKKSEFNLGTYKNNSLGRHASYSLVFKCKCELHKIVLPMILRYE